MKSLQLTTSLLILGLAAAARETTPEGVAPLDWSAIRAEYQRHRHAVVPAADQQGHQARNPGQQWQIRFDGRGFEVKALDGWTWGLELERFGFAGAERKLEVRAVKPEGNKMRYQRGEGLEEWFINDPRGLEQGFTLAERPQQGGGSGWLHFEMAVRGGLKPQHAGGDAVSFASEAGAVMLRYSGLKAWDASGRTLAARFELVEGRRVRIAVDERGAQYPLTVDPTAFNAYLKASNPGIGDEFGTSVAVSGTTVVVGGPREDSNARGVGGNQMDNSASNSGAAYVFRYAGGAWTQEAYLKSSNSDAGDEFGSAVAISGGIIAVAAQSERSNANGVGGNQSDNSAPSAGAAYVFRRTSAGWVQEAYLKCDAGYRKLVSVAVSGNTVATGCLGRVGVFTRSAAGVWTRQAGLTASNYDGWWDSFGHSVALFGDTLVAGAYGEESNATGVNGNQLDNSVPFAGAAYVFRRTGTSWSQEAYLKASNPGTWDRFGFAVAVYGSYIVVGAFGEASNATGIDGDQANNSAPDTGAVYVFRRSTAGWSQEAYLKPQSAHSRRTYFGLTVAVRQEVDGTVYVASGARLGVDGIVWIHERVVGSLGLGVWATAGSYTAPNAESADNFGVALAMSDDKYPWVVVGASFEDSSATGVNGDMANNSTSSSGAAYVFSIVRKP